MPTNLNSYLDVLPVELIYHIINYLDSDTILLSFRYVCQRFYIISNAYNRYKLYLNSSTKHNFHRYCRIIDPLNIISLILSDDDQTPGQINLFLKYFNFTRFNYLRSLTLLEIEDSNLYCILKEIPCRKLTSLTIKTRTFLTWTNETLSCLSSILEQSSLKQFTFGIWCFEIYDFIWPNQCRIEYLCISNRITFEQYCNILEQCSFLQIFIVKDVLWNDVNTMIANQYRQLKSLTLEDNRMDIYKLELFLTLTPSLTYLKVIGMAYLIDSYRWEIILRIKLPYLDRFEFYFQSWKNVNYNLSDIDSLIRPFQTVYWLENKKWMVNCDYIMNPSEVILYSMPICKSSFQYHNSSNKISISNFENHSTDQTMMNNVSELRINVMKAIVNAKVTILSSNYFFGNVTKLILDLDEKCPESICQSLSSLINLSHLKQLTLNINYELAADTNTKRTLLDLLEQTSNLTTFEISNNLSSVNFDSTIDDICSLIPSHIQHLKITVKNINEMKVVFDQFEYLSSITFRFSFYKSLPSAKIIESFLKIKRDLTYRKDDRSIRVWLNQCTKTKAKPVISSSDI